MKAIVPLQPGRYYHVYNRGNNGEDLFREERNYRHFLHLYSHHVHPIADTFAYCLLRNHFHLLVRIRTETEWRQSADSAPAGVQTCSAFKPSQPFSNLFNAYTKAINKAYERTGSLFEDRFERVEVTADSHFVRLIVYIHFNPQKHGFVKDFRDWPWSSYNALRTPSATRLKRDQVMSWFGNMTDFEAFHGSRADEQTIGKLVGDDFV